MSYPVSRIHDLSGVDVSDKPIEPISFDIFIVINKVKESTNNFY